MLARKRKGQNIPSTLRYHLLKSWLVLSVLFLIASLGSECVAVNVLVVDGKLTADSVTLMAADYTATYIFEFFVDDTLFVPSSSVINVDIKPKVTATIRDSGDKVVIYSNYMVLTLGKKSFSFEVEDLKETLQLREALKNGIKDYYISIESDLKITMKNGDSLVIPPDVLKDVKFSHTLSAGQISDIVRVTEGYDPQYKTRMNAAIEPIKSDSLDKQAFFDFAFAQRLPFNLLFGAQAAVSGVVSSDKNSPSSVIRFTPLSVKLKKKDYLYLDIGFDINQSGSLETLRLSVYWDFLLPFNLVNLTQGEKRLRLFPVMTVGANLLRYTQAEEASVPSEKTYGELFFDMYYYIPVYDRYSLLVEGEAFWRTNENGDFHRDDARWQWDFTLGYDIKGGGTKVMAKYSVGVDQHSFEKDEKILIGVLFDLFDQTEE